MEIGRDTSEIWRSKVPEKKLEIWGRAQREAARRSKSDWGDNLEERGLKFRS